MSKREEEARALWLGSARVPTANPSFLCPPPRCSLFYFAGGVRMGDTEYSGMTRQRLFNLSKEWKDPEFGVRAVMQRLLCRAALPTTSPHMPCPLALRLQPRSVSHPLLPLQCIHSLSRALWATTRRS